MYKQDLVLNNLQWLICHKTKPNQTLPKEYHSTSLNSSRAITFTF